MFSEQFIFNLDFFFVEQKKLLGQKEKLNLHFQTWKENFLFHENISFGSICWPEVCENGT